MPLQLPCRLCADVADRLVGASTLDAAYESIRTAFRQAGSATVLIVVRKNHDWHWVAGPTEAGHEAGWLAAIRKLRGVDVVTTIGDDTPATVVWIDDDEPTVVVLDQDWFHAAEVLATCAAVIRLGLRRVRTEQRDTATRRIVRSALRLTRKRRAGTDRDALAANVVECAARMFRADRVSLALYAAEEHALKIAAAHGLPDHVVSGVRIRPGDWALGHVYSSSRALTVQDVRLLPSRTPNRARYKSHSFAAVPLIYGDETLGVLSITDRRDDLEFTDADRVALLLLGAAAGAAISAAAARDHIRRLEHKASIDSITALFNRGYFDTRLAEEVERSQRERTRLAVLIADIDDFKSINDTFGHQTGDAVLRQVGEIIRSAVRLFDVCARFGGDEFAVLMPNSDDASALACAERIRKIAAQYHSPRAASFPQLTVSVGVAVSAAHEGAASVVARADRALYQAKAAGKNAVRDDRDVNERLRASGGDLPPHAEPMQLAYMLVADATAERQAAYQAAAQRHRLGLLLARDAHQASRLMNQFGPPVVLIVDLASPEMQHLALNSLSNADRDVRVVAFTSARDVRAFFRASSNAPKLHLLNHNAAIAVVETVLSRTLAVADVVPPPAQPAGPAGTDPLAALTARTRDVIGAPGSAAYMLDPQSGQMRGVIRWTGNEPLRRCQYFLPRAIEQVLSSGVPVMLGDIAQPSERNDRRSQPYGATHALLAAPIKQLDRTVGAVCLFDDGAISVSEQTLNALKALTASVVEPTAVGSAAPATPHPRPSGARTRATDVVGSAPDADNDPAATLDWAPTLLERHRGEFEVAKELARMRREQRQLSVVLFDVSHGLRYRQDPQQLGGHTDADDALQNVVDTFVRAVRQSDLPIRWSGNELVLVLPGVAGVEARAVAERVRAAMEAGGHRNISVSGSVAELERDEQLGSVVDRARVKVDQLLARGHNRVS